MEKDYYTLSEIILGLRDEYQKHQNELRELKELCEIDKKKAVDFRFSVFQPENKNPELHCDYEPKQNKIQKLMTDISIKTGSYIYGKHSAILATDNNSYHFCYPKYPVHVRYEYGMDEKFQEQATSILNSEFSQNIKTKYIEPVNPEIDYAFDLEQRLIDFYIRESNDEFQESSITCRPYEDIINIRSFDKELSSEMINNALEIKVPKKELSSYHIGIIDSSKITEKPIKLERTEPCKKIDFSIQEEEKQVVLSKVRNIE